MEPSSLHALSIFLIIQFLCYQTSHSQQKNLNITEDDCSENPSITKGYLCNGPLKSCMSFITFRSQSPFNTPSTIANLLGSVSSSIITINNLSNDDKVAPNKTVIVPVSCLCSGNIYSHQAYYTVQAKDYYHLITNSIYQGLVSCKALMGQNYYANIDIPVGAELTVPIRCACPTQNQTKNGVTALLNYMVASNDTVRSIGEAFGVDEESILEANMLSKGSVVYKSTRILVPLKRESCKVNPNYFFCSCSSGLLTGDGSIEGLNCTTTADGKKFTAKMVALLGAGIGTLFLCLFLSGYKLYTCLMRRRKKILKEKLFKQNGGFLLQQKFSFYGSGEKAKLFTAEELERATDNYNQSRFLGQGGYGSVYKGMLRDGSIVAVKKSVSVDKNWIEQFINEIIILSEINHRNIVRLLGFCLEAEAPVLVYEFIHNGTLSQHINRQDLESSLSWENRLRIASEVAGAIAYMHSAASIPIFHRDIKSSNILLNDNYTAKVSDFGTSRSVFDDKTHITTEIQGTFGYMDPEYLQSCQFTEKSDVYSFGVVLVEVLTGTRPFSYAGDSGRNLVSEFISLTAENQLVQILDPRVAKEASNDDISVVAKLAVKCLRLNGKLRPTMKEVSMELEGLKKTQKCLEMVQEPQLTDEAKCMNTEGLSHDQDSIEDMITFPIEMESSSSTNHSY